MLEEGRAETFLEWRRMIRSVNLGCLAKSKRGGASEVVSRGQFPKMTSRSPLLSKYEKLRLPQSISSNIHIGSLEGSSLFCIATSGLRALTLVKIMFRDTFLRSSVSFLLLSALSASFAGAEVAKKEPSREELLKAAETGRPDQQLAYAKFIYDSDHQASREWARKAAEGGLAEGWYWLGYTGVSTEEASMYAKAAEGGYEPAFEAAFEKLLFRAGREANVKEAHRLAQIYISRNSSLDSNQQRMIDTVNECYEAGDAEIPESEQPTAEETEKYRSAECNLFAAGIWQKKDLHAYGRCTLVHEAGEYTDNYALAELFANGWGVKRNAKLAIAHACHGSEVPMELFSTVALLKVLKDAEASGGSVGDDGKPFEFCNHVTSSNNIGRCAAWKAYLNAEAAKKSLLAVTKNWSKAEQDAYERLSHLRDAYIEKRVQGEVDLSGSLRATFQTGEQENLEKQFLKALKEFEKKKYPNDKNLAAAEKILKEKLAVISSKQDFSYGTVQKDAILETQKAWTAYREGWVYFASHRYPKIPGDVFATWVTKTRIEQLSQFIR